MEAILHLPHLDLRGLMGVPPYFDDPEEAQTIFPPPARIARAMCARNWDRKYLPVLSMGMSHDFEVAIEEGATEMRVGTALFGEREKA